MCTLVLLHRCVTATPVVVLANRDEWLTRPSLPPHQQQGSPAVLCGIDKTQGGTWCGINEHGLFVGLTNFTVGLPDPARRSRGLLCLDMLRAQSLEEVATAIGQLAAKAFNPFRLLAADRCSAMQVTSDQSIEVQRLAPGVHVTTNWPAGSIGGDKQRRIEQLVRGAMERSTRGTELVEALARVSSTHDKGGDPRASLCCHAPGYGTRCSTIIAFGDDPADVTYLHSEGPPCEHDHVSYTDSARALLLAGGGRG